MRDSVASMSNSPIDCLRRNVVEAVVGINGGVVGGVPSLPKMLRAVFFSEPVKESMETSETLFSTRSSFGALQLAPMAPMAAATGQGNLPNPASQRPIPGMRRNPETARFRTFRRLAAARNRTLIAPWGQSRWAAPRRRCSPSWSPPPRRRAPAPQAPLAQLPPQARLTQGLTRQALPTALRPTSLSLPGRTRPVFGANTAATQTCSTTSKRSALARRAMMGIPTRRSSTTATKSASHRRRRTMSGNASRTLTTRGTPSFRRS